MVQTHQVLLAILVTNHSGGRLLCCEGGGGGDPGEVVERFGQALRTRWCVQVRGDLVAVAELNMNPPPAAASTPSTDTEPTTTSHQTSHDSNPTKPELDITLATLQTMPCFSHDLLTFFQCFENYSHDNLIAKELRRKEWSSLDGNGSGHVSLAETTRWIKNSLIHFTKNNDEGERLYRRYYPCYIRAFLDAADTGIDKKIKGMSSQTTEDDFIQKGEFRLMTAYLCIYAMMYETFTVLDGSRDSSSHSHHSTTAAASTSVFRMERHAPLESIDGDRRITSEEWRQRAVTLGETPFIGLNAVIQSPEALESVFQQMDADGKGAILLREYCQWIKQREIEFQTSFGRLLHVGVDCK